MKHLIQRSKRPQLALVLTALLVIVCRGPQKEASWFGPGCVSYATYLLEGQVFGLPEYSCPIPCPDGSTVIAEGNDDDNYSEISARGLAACPAPAVTATPTFAPQPNQPTPTVSATPQPVLSGEVSACSLVDRYINFSLASETADTDGLQLQVTMDAQPVQCEVPASNKKVLSCSLPNGQTFPVEVNLLVDGHLTDTFMYDGSGCAGPNPDNGDPDPEPDGEPICSGLPPYPEGCTPP